MAQYDGSIRIGTEITTKQAEKELKSLESSISKTADKIASLRKKMDALKDTKIPTDEYKEIQNQIDATEKKINDLQARQEKFLATGGKESSSTYQRMQYDVDELKASIPYLKSELQDLEETGKALTFGPDTEKYAQMSAQMQQLNQQMESDTQRQSELQSSIAAEEQRLADIKANSTVSDQQIIDLLERRKQLIAEIKDMEAAGVSLGYKQYEDANRELEEINGKIKDYKKNLESVPEKFEKMRASAKKAFDAVSSGAKKSDISLGKSFKTILKYDIGIRSLYALINKLRAAIKEGFSNLAQFSAPVNESISALMSSLTRLKNSLATAFAPILNVIAPAITALINMLSQAVTYVGMFIAALTGASTFTKAIAVQEDYAASLNKTAGAAKKAAGALASFDTLEVLSKKDQGAGGGAGAGAFSPAEMFEEIPVDKLGDIAEFSDKAVAMMRNLKDAAKGALSALKKLWNEGLSLFGSFAWDTLRDFYDHFLVPVGKWILGEGLPRLFDITNKLLKSINWGTLQRRLRDFYDVLAKLAEFTFKALLDFYEYFLAPVAVWTMNRALPMLLQTLTDLGNKINWDLLNSALASMWQTLSKFAIGIGEGLILFWKGIEPLVTSAVAGIINGIALALQLFFDVLGMIPDGVLVALGGAIGGLLSVIVSYAAASLVMDSLKTAWTGLYVAFDDGLKLLLAHPYVAVAAGIGAVVGALLSLQERAKERAEIEAYGKTIEDLTSQFQNSRDEIERRAKSASEYVDNAGLAEISHAENLKEKYSELAEKQNKSNEEYALMRSYASQLADIIPGLSEHINEETGLLDLQAGSIQALIDKQQEYYRVQAAKEKIIELYQAQFDMEEELKRQTEAVKKAQEEYNEALEENAIKSREAIENGQAKSGVETIALQEARDNLRELNTELQNSITAYDEIGSSIDNMTQTIVEGETKLSEAGVSGGQAYKKGVADSINQQMGWETEAVKGLANKINKDMGWDIAGKDGADGYAEGFKNNTSVIEEAVKTATKAGISAAREAQDSHSPSKEYKSLAKDAVDGYVLGIEENKSSSVTAIKTWAAEILNAMKSTLGIGASEGEEDSGASTSMFDGILSGFTSTWESFLELWTSNLGTWKETNDELYFGYDIWYEQFSNILTAYIDMFTEFSSQWQADMNTWWTTMVMPFFTVAQWQIFGTNMKNGIINGFKTIVNQIGGLLNKIISLFNAAFNELENAMNKLIDDYNSKASALGTSTLSRVSYSPMASVKIPALATGAVIRGGNPFMAILGDQPRGQTNVEAPAGLIRDMVAEGIEKSMNNLQIGGGTLKISVNINGEDLARVTLQDFLSEMNRQGYDVDLLGWN